MHVSALKDASWHKIFFRYVMSGMPSEYPLMPTDPTISYNVQTSSSNVRFDCKAASANETGAVYSFVWVSGAGANLRSITHAADTIMDSLNSADLQQTARDSVLYHGVRSFFHLFSLSLALSLSLSLPVCVSLSLYLSHSLYLSISLSLYLSLSLSLSLSRWVYTCVYDWS
jgi:hypothetical protein